MTTFVDRVLRLWREPLDGRMDPAADFREVYADPVTVNGLAVTAEEMVERARALQRAYAALEFEVVHEIEASDKIILAFRLRGRHVGPLETPLGTLAPTGRRVENRATDILTVRDGRVSDIWVISDDLSLLRQLGAVSVVESMITV
jgi:ketosteroid isomerase-like protein